MTTLVIEMNLSNANRLIMSCTKFYDGDKLRSSMVDDCVNFAMKFPFMDRTASSCHREQVSLATVEYLAMIWLLVMIDPLFITTH